MKKKASNIKLKDKMSIPVSVSNCSFVGGNIIWDGKAIEAVADVAKALKNLTEVFRSQNIQQGSLMTIQAGETEGKISTMEEKR